MSSGPLSVPLEAGHYYLFGVAVTGAHDVVIQEGLAPVPLSFGQMLGGFALKSGVIPTIPNQLQVGQDVLADDMSMRLQSATP